MKLRLCAPLFYTKIEIKNDDFCRKMQKNEEFLLCFEINPLQSCNIEPDQGQFLGSAVFFGRKSGEPPPNQEENLNLSEENKKIEDNGTVSLPKGLYLLTQQRSGQALDRAEWLDMAIEQQIDGLWERNKMGNLLYVRYLYEDEAFVTQVFRPVEN